MSSEDDFRRIQHVTEQAAAKLTALRQNLNSKLESFSTSEKKSLREKVYLPLSPQVPESSSTRLASIAASLSPSNYSSPSSNRAINATAHFPISTPPMTRTGSSTPGTVKSFPRSNPVTEDPVTRIVQNGLDSILSDFEAKAADLIAKTQAENADREKCFEEFLVELSNRETAAMEQIVNTVRMIGADDGSDIREELIEEGFQVVQREMVRQKSENEKIRKLMVSDKLRQMFGEVFGRIETELSGWRSRVDRCLAIDTEGLKQEIVSAIRTHIENEISHVREECMAQIEAIRSTYDRNDASVLGNLPVYATARSEHSSVATKLAAENSELKSLVRKMKLSLAKWRIDYLNHAKLIVAESKAKPASKTRTTRDVDGASTSFSTPVITAGAGIPNIDPGPQFPVLSESLMKMWSAVPPSGEELVQFLVNMEAAVNSGGKIPLSSVYDYECSKNIDKLPLAQLAAQRELLVSSGDFDDSELRNLDRELLGMIYDYETRYKQRFVFSNAEEDGYAQAIERQNPDIPRRRS